MNQPQTKNTRPSWDEYFINITLEIAKRSTCDRANVGTTLVKDRRIISTGYNGSPSGLGHCDQSGHILVDNHCIRTIHAETNAIIQAALHGVSTKDSTCYVTHFPCANCAKVLVNAGIVKIVYLNDYRVDENSLMFLRNVELVKFDLLAEN